MKMAALKILIAALSLLFFIPAPAADFANAAYSVCFTPGQNCTSEIVGAIHQAKRSILVQAYSFTSAPIAKALVQAKSKGVDVRVILDKSQRSQKYSSYRFFTNQGVPVWIDDRVAIAHNKVMVLDGETVITGSFNFTKAAQNKNAENVLIIKDSGLASAYAANWWRRIGKSSENYQAPWAA